MSENCDRPFDSATQPRPPRQIANLMVPHAPEAALNRTGDWHPEVGRLRRFLDPEWAKHHPPQPSLIHGFPVESGGAPVLESIGGNRCSPVESTGTI
jgi:hypothetical protein